MHVFGLLHKARVPRENPRIHQENMQTPHREAVLGKTTAHTAKTTSISVVRCMCAQEDITLLNGVGVFKLLST